MRPVLLDSIQIVPRTFRYETLLANSDCMTCATTEVDFDSFFHVSGRHQSRLNEAAIERARTNARKQLRTEIGQLEPRFLAREGQMVSLACARLYDSRVDMTIHFCVLCSLHGCL
jgi:hypothetical protein